MYDWRRGVVEARLGLAAVELGHQSLAAKWFTKAARMAEGVAQDADGQIWQRDRIRALLAIGYKRLGKIEDALKAAENLTPAEAAHWQEEVAETLDERTFDMQLQVIDHAVQTSDMQTAMNAAGIGRTPRVASEACGSDDEAMGIAGYHPGLARSTLSKASDLFLIMVIAAPRPGLKTKAGARRSARACRPRG